MKQETAIKVLFTEYCENPPASTLETEKEEAFAAMDAAVKGDNEVMEKAVSLENACLEAAFVAGFQRAAELYK